MSYTYKNIRVPSIRICRYDFSFTPPNFTKSIKYIANSDYYKYSSTLQNAPCPRCICFYNVTAKQLERQILKLSNAFSGESDIEVKVTMLNINYGFNLELMKACRPPEEYSWLVDAVRRHQQRTNNLKEAVEEVISEMPDEFLIKNFLLSNKAEVKGMFLTEWDQEKVLEQERRDSENLTIIKVNELVARDMLIEGEPLEKIIKYSKLVEILYFKKRLK